MKHTIDGLLWFTDLSDDAKNIARLWVTSMERAAFNNTMLEYKRRPLHSRINNPAGLRILIKGHSALFKIKSQGNAYLDKFIISNFCEFDKEGQLYTFKNGVYSVHTPDTVKED